MIWAKVSSGRFYSNNDGTERKQTLDIQDWGLEVKDVLYGAVVRGRSSANAKFKIGHDEGATADVNAMTAAADPIGFTQVNFNIPRTIKGVVAPAQLPYFRPVISVAAFSGNTEEYVDIDLYIGGKPF